MLISQKTGKEAPAVPSPPPEGQEWVEGQGWVRGVIPKSEIRIPFTIKFGEHKYGRINKTFP
jgi:hypothetical protein